MTLYICHMSYIYIYIYTHTHTHKVGHNLVTEQQHIYTCINTYGERGMIKSMFLCILLLVFLTLEPLKLSAQEKNYIQIP